MKKGSSKLNKKTLIIILLVVALVCAAFAVIIHQTTKLTNDSYANCAMGDVNGDGKIDSLDAFLIIDHINNNTELFENQLLHADVNEDKQVDSMDVLILIRYTVGEVRTLPWKISDEEDLNTNPSQTDEKLKAEVKIINDWESEDAHMYQLSITVKNVSDRTVNDWCTKITFNERVEIENDWGCKTLENGEIINVSGESIVSESSAACGVIIKASSALTIENIETE